MSDDEQVPGADGGAAVGLAPGMRYRCEGCGNLTRFDIRVTERGVRFWHAAVSGQGRVEAVEDAELEVEQVTCRWCGATDRVVVERAPLADGAGT